MQIKLPVAHGRVISIGPGLATLMYAQSDRRSLSKTDAATLDDLPATSKARVCLAFCLVTRVVLGFAEQECCIEKLREQARREGLDANQWFDNMELVAAKEIGQVTVIYVRNVYKYYIAYKLATEPLQNQQEAKQGRDN